MGDELYTLSSAESSGMDPALRPDGTGQSAILVTSDREGRQAHRR